MQQTRRRKRPNIEFLGPRAREPPRTVLLNGTVEEPIDLQITYANRNCPPSANRLKIINC